MVWNDGNGTGNFFSTFKGKGMSLTRKIAGHG
jgi:hypothetical protein